MNNPYIEGAEADAFDFGYQQGKADAECRYTSKVFERLREVDADFISIDHLIEVLEWAKEQLKENNEQI